MSKEAVVLGDRSSVVLVEELYQIDTWTEKQFMALRPYATAILINSNRQATRMRNLMNPFFSSNNRRDLIPNIREIGRKLVDRWESLGFVGRTVDISCTLNDAALDTIGSRKSFDSLSDPTKFGQLLDAVLPYVPDSIFRLAFHLPIPSMGLIREYHKMTDELSFNLAAQKRDEMGSGLIGGFGRLAQMTEFQQELRQEIQVASLKDPPEYNSLPLLNAVIRRSLLVRGISLTPIFQEVLRMYTPLPLLERVVTEDCVVPLSQPIATTNGIQISEIPMKKGECLYVAVASYHRLISIWGPDAREFRPSRWLQKEPGKGPVLGPHAPLVAFFGGPGVCLGWRFAQAFVFSIRLLELQVFVVEIVGRFILSLPETTQLEPALP
ncbi:cytochrome P450 [Mycena maculata]|uniref:Cytochrome P450 n=1 Tax=Mycena maculata TaxID=230809 RepID=A0AAD7IN60_9AGAR|nr:cytochrome P450 [Mycena maculata]